MLWSILLIRVVHFEDCIRQSRTRRDKFGKNAKLLDACQFVCSLRVIDRVINFAPCLFKERSYLHLANQILLVIGGCNKIVNAGVIRWF